MLHLGNRNWGLKSRQCPHCYAVASLLTTPIITITVVIVSLTPLPLAVCVPPPDLSLLTRIPGRPYKEPAEIKVERDDSLDRDGKEFSKQSSGKNSSKGKRKHKVGRTPRRLGCGSVGHGSHRVEP